ncbi:MAG: hypothetical protein IKV52_04780 [Oscillospiraceae bacterium]|nr:hypothetical protein [Oscillospiraceae bacterium]
MSDSKNIDKILQDIKMRQATGGKPTEGMTPEKLRLQEIIKAETASAAPADSAKLQQTISETVAAVQNKMPPEIKEEKTASSTITAGPDHEIENEFLSKLATALKDSPKTEPSSVPAAEKRAKPVSVNAATYVDEKFVDFFTQTVAVPKQAQPSREIVVKQKKRGFFKKKYITDSLSLSIPQEEIDRHQQKVHQSTQELAKEFISRAAGEVKQETADITIKPKTVKPTTDTKEVVADIPQPVVVAEKTVAEKVVQTAAPKPTDVDGVLAALKAKQKPQAVLETVAQITPQTASQPEESTVQTPAEFVPAVCEDMENTGYIPVVNQQTTREVTILPKEEDSKVQQITGDITQLFSHLENSETVQPVTETEEETEAEEEQVFEELVEEEPVLPAQFSDDPEEIVEELKSFKSTLVARVAVSAVSAVVLLYLNFAAVAGLPVPSAISPAAQPAMFYLVSMLFYTIALVGFLPAVANGLTGFAKSPTQDSFIALPALLCFAQLVASVFASNNIDPAHTTVFAGFMAVAFGFNALGKLLNANTIMRNLDLAQVPEGINAGYIIKDAEDVKRLARTLDEKNPQILVSRRTGYISNFVSGGFSVHKSEKNSRVLSICCAAVSAVCFALCLVKGGSVTQAISAAAGASVFMLPLSHSMISSVPGAFMQKALNQVGALVNGWQGIYQLSDATHVSFDAKHLFPKGCIVLHGIKTFEKERLDLAILYAASIAIEKCDNLRGVFLSVIDNKMDMLYPLENCEYKVGQGYIAWIEGNRVILGNRSIMEEYSVNVPPISTETRYTSEGKKPVYLSVNGKLFGMFVVSYHPDDAVKENLLHLVKQGKSVILQSNDFNIDSQLLELVYSLPADTVQVLNKNETALLLGYTAYSENTDCAMAHLDSLHSLSAGFFGADSASRAAAICSLVQIIGIAIGAVLSVVFTFSGTIGEIPLLSILMLGLGWFGLTMIKALATKYL